MKLRLKINIAIQGFSLYKTNLTNATFSCSTILFSQLIIFFDIEASFSNNLLIGFWFTLISVIRNYAVRRWFNKKVKLL